MSNRAIPCTKCLRLHFGTCREFPKQCTECGAVNYIDQLYPQRGVSRFWWNPDEPIPGSHAWCEKHQLDRDPELKQKIINSLKTSPGHAIWLNGVRIYEGIERHFSSAKISRENGNGAQPPQTQRSRSRSPIRERTRESSRPPLRASREQLIKTSSSQRKLISSSRLSKTDLFGYEQTPLLKSETSSPTRMVRFRSPLRRLTPSLTKRSEATARSNKELRRSWNSPPKRIKLEPGAEDLISSLARRRAAGIPLFSYHPAEPRPALCNISNTKSPRKEEDGSTKKLKSPASKELNPHKWKRTFVEVPPVEILNVDDPCFVLGVIEGASEREVFNAYMRRMGQLDLDKLEYEKNKEEDVPDMSRAFDKSVKLLNAARKKLIGY